MIRIRTYQIRTRDMRGSEKANSASKMNSVLRDYVKISGFIRNFKRNIGRKNGDNIVNLLFCLDSHTLIICMAFETLHFFFFFFFFYNMKFHMNSDNTTLINVNVSYEFLKSLSTFQKNVPQLSIQLSYNKDRI